MTQHKIEKKKTSNEGFEIRSLDMKNAYRHGSKIGRTVFVELIGMVGLYVDDLCVVGDKEFRSKVVESLKKWYVF